MIVFIAWTVIAILGTSHVVANLAKRLKKAETLLLEQDLQIKRLNSKTAFLDRPLSEEEAGEQDCPACMAPLNSHVGHRPCTTSTAP